MWRLLLKKFGLSLLCIVNFIIGVFLWALTVYPFNLPYLLHLPAEQTDAVTASVFSLLFVCIVTVVVRTKWCYENDLFFSQKGEKPRSLFLRVVMSQEFIADVIVFAGYVAVLTIHTAVTSNSPWYMAIPVSLILIVTIPLPYALLDCVLYMIARKKANRRLRKREED